jgi:mono/diheme cytochrome c family protein
MNARLTIVVFTLAVVLLPTLGRSESPNLDRGKSTYQELCSKCHGSGGKGDGKEAATLATKPKDLSECPRMAGFTDDQLFRIIKEGGPAAKLSKDMPPYRDALEDDEIRDTLAYVRSLCPR